MRVSRFGLRVRPILLATTLSWLAHAQTPTSTARITSLTGTVTVRHGDTGAEEPGAVGSALAVGDCLATRDASSAELRLDNHVFQLAANSDVRLTPGKGVGMHAVALDQGSVTYRVLPGSTLADVNTPSVTVGPAITGVYRISVTAAGESEIVVKGGIVFVSAPAGTQAITDRQKMLVHGPADNPEYKIMSTTPKWLRVLSSIVMISLQAAGEAAAALPGGTFDSQSDSKAGHASSAKAALPASPPRTTDPSKSTASPSANQAK
jgi:hypothetical protein